VGSRAGLDVVAKRIDPCPFRECKSGGPSSSPVIIL